MVATEDVVDKVVKKLPWGIGLGVCSYHRGFIYDEQRIAVLVGGFDDSRVSVGVGSSGIDDFMYCESVVSRVCGKDFGGTASGSKKPGMELKLGRGLYEGADERGLSGSGVAFEDEGGVRVGIVEKPDYSGASFALSGGRLMGKMGEYQLLDGLEKFSFSHRCLQKEDLRTQILLMFLR